MMLSVLLLGSTLIEARFANIKKMLPNGSHSQFKDYGCHCWTKGKSGGIGGVGRDALEGAIRRRYFARPLQVTIRAKAEVYNNEQRTNVSCIEARPVPRGEHGRFLLAELKTMLEKEALASSAGGA